ncbi:Transcriptional regulatory protein CitB, DpiA [Marinobacterium lacunae]|uniref:Transcriptional regulatory protein n=1 Tax=Marinobacterium lacunae TaxID=1232683 RepID=A0A081FX90_9GAMM|nr:response regulator [Marinobacterium lacunae]KEA63145.1 Transcriptional regulatory protein CitB, DpiA [Marinobacterium lacunae]MBR9885059.1 response regulator [Oceanospirillales bacterium]
MSTPLGIVIAEDDPQIAEIQRRFVERVSGFEVRAIAHTTRDARELIEVLRPNLVMLDIQFPDGSGLELLRELRAARQPTDVILITAAKEVDSLTEALRCGVFDYILKPLVYERLEQSLHNYLSHLERLRQLGSLSQQSVDGLLPRSGTSVNSVPAPSRLPKGIDTLTLDKVRAVMAQTTDSYSAEQVGECIGSSRTTARRYLEYLVSEQELEADINYGSIGRPERRYKRSTV